LRDARTKANTKRLLGLRVDTVMKLVVAKEKVAETFECSDTVHHLDSRNSCMCMCQTSYSYVMLEIPAASSQLVLWRWYVSFVTW